MQFLSMTKDMTLSALSKIVGGRNVDTVLNANGLSRTVDIGKKFFERKVEGADVDNQKKSNILTQFVGDSDILKKLHWVLKLTGNLLLNIIVLLMQ